MPASHRSQFIAGLSLIGTLGWLISAWVIPGQWLSGHVRHEALVGVTVSTLCVVTAAAIERRSRTIVIALLTTVGLSALGYAVAILMAATDVGRAAVFGRPGAIVLALSAIAAASLWQLSRMKRMDIAH